jgi:probable F420-dependent oxidoreductase
MTAFLDGLDAADPPVRRERRAIAALAPRMLALSAERSLGALPYFVPVEHTAVAREAIGSRALLATEVAVVVDDDAVRARGVAREFARTYLGLANYTANLRRLGWADDDLAGDGSDALLDAVVPHGTAEQLAGVARAHLAAGADHVAVQTLGETGRPPTGLRRFSRGRRCTARWRRSPIRRSIPTAAPGTEPRQRPDLTRTSPKSSSAPPAARGGAGAWPRRQPSSSARRC